MINDIFSELTRAELQAINIVFRMLDSYLERTDDLLSDLPEDAQLLISEFVLLDNASRKTIMKEIEAQQTLYSTVSDLYGSEVAEQIVDNISGSAPAVVDPILSLISDDDANNVSLIFPEWAVGMLYPIGFRARYNGGLYSCNQLHTSQADWTPPLVPALWRQIGEPGVIPEWIQPTGAQDAYNTGDKVTHNDKTWESLVDANVWEPGTAGTENLWKEI